MIGSLGSYSQLVNWKTELVQASGIQDTSSWRTEQEVTVKDLTLRCVSMTEGRAERQGIKKNRM